MYYILLCIVSVVGGSAHRAYGQNFLNGSFENNTAVGNVINPTNPQFNNLMSNCVSFGTAANIDIITSNIFAGGPQHLDWYVALHGSPSDQMTMELSTPVVAGECYTISFYDKASNPSPNHIPTPIQIGLSTTSNAIGTAIYTTPVPPQLGVWNNRVFTFIAPITAQYVSVSVPGIFEAYSQVDNFSFIDPELNLGNDTTLCQGEVLNLNPVLQGVAPNNLTYLWQDGSTNAQYTVTQAGVYFVEVQFGGCSYHDTIEVTYNPLPTVELGPDTNLCPGESITLDGSVGLATGFLWSDNSTGSLLQVNSTGLYKITVSNSCGTAIDSVNVLPANLPVNPLGSDTTLCERDTIVLDATWPNGTYRWENLLTVPMRAITQGGTYWVEVEADNCSIRDTVTILEIEYPDVELGSDTALCEGDVLPLISGASSSINVTWSTGQTTASIQVDSTALYWVEGSNVCGDDKDSIDVLFYDRPPLNLGSDTMLCRGDSLVKNVAVSGGSYLWQDQSTNEVFVIDTGGVFTVKIEQNGCWSIDSIVVEAIDVPWIDFGPDTTYCTDHIQTFEFLAPNTVYQWHNGSTWSNYVVREPEEIWVTATNICGSNNDSLAIKYENCACYFYVPTAFSPDGNELNETYFPQFDCDVVGYSFYIFDRWGNELFYSTELNVGWDGTFNGTAMPVGVYVYRLLYKGRLGEFQEKFEKLF